MKDRQKEMNEQNWKEGEKKRRKEGRRRYDQTVIDSLYKPTQTGIERL